MINPPASKNSDILRGRYQDLPNVRSKIVRIFVSSTFSDTLCERDSLIESVFPKLKDYCRERYGLEFQYSDMRWGIQTESSDNHSEVHTCLNEIELCQKYSLATNFVVLLSHRYGSRPTPAKINATLFERLHQLISLDQNRQEDAEMLSAWYQLDTNSMPSAYILRSISSMIPEIKSSDTTEMKDADKKWKKVNNRIRMCLREAAAICLEQGHITPNEYDDFFVSVTEKEIINGILNVSNANERTLCFIREIENIAQNISDSKAEKFIDLTRSEDGTVIIDREAENLLNRLKNERIPSVLKQENIYTYKVPWKTAGINRTDHAEYLSKFHDDFYQSLKEQIDRCIQSRLSTMTDPLEHEIQEHAIQCKTYVAKFHGRTDVLEHLQAYIKHPMENRPCVVYGDSGCGKTSVMAKAAIEAFKWWSDRSVSVILRFLGTTPTSSTGYKMMLSLSQHICKLYNLPMIIYTDILQLRHQLETIILPNIPENESLIILLDSIDQLDPDSYTCTWLPEAFPENVKCIVSTLPKHGSILTYLQIAMKHDEQHPQRTEHLLVSVPPFLASTVEVVYHDWLTMKQRSLSEEQRVFIRDMMKERTEILPLFMKLIFDIVSTWHSYDTIDVEFKKLKSVDDCIRYLFNYLQKIHNPLLFRRAICYMTASRNGISQNELEDVLSLDDDVLKSVFEHYIPPVRRIPGILWTRIRNDLEEYITEKEADDAPVIYWYHRRFIEVSNSQFISKMDSNERKNVFQNMVDFYNETWKGKNKPFKIENQKLVEKYNLNQSNGEIQANRLTTSQPVEFIDANGCVQFNKRKLNELPAFITQLTSNLAVPLAAEVIYFNYPFMRAKLACSAFDDVFADLQKIKQSSSYHMSGEAQNAKKELDIFASVYLITGALLQNYPDNFPFEFSARLLTLYGSRPHTTRLLQSFDEQSIRYCSLIVPYPQIQPPGSGLIYSMNRHTTAVVDLDFTDDQMVAISLSDRIIVIDMREASTVLDIDLPVLDESYVNSTTLPELSSHSRNGPDSATTDSGDGEDKTLRFKKYFFLVNSHHHLYLLSANENIKFERSSKAGFAAVEVFNRKWGLAVIVENQSNSVDCWDLIKNSLFHRFEYPGLTVKKVLCLRALSMLITVLENGTIYFHRILDWTNPSFVHFDTIQLGSHLNLVTVDRTTLILTFDESVPIDFAMIDLNPDDVKEDHLDDDKMLKTSVTFNPSINPKPIKEIILPDREAQSNGSSSDNFAFVAKTDDAIYVVHKCADEELSYVKINGRFDLVSVHAKGLKNLYTARGGMIQLHRWSCVKHQGKQGDATICSHKYELYVSFDISSSPVTSIRPAADGGSMFLCSMKNGVIQAYYTVHARKALKHIKPFPRTTEVIQSIKLCEQIAVTLDNTKRELTAWSYQHAASIHSTYTFRDDITIKDFAVTSSLIDSTTIFVLIITNTHWIHIYSTKSLDKDPIFSSHIRSPSRVHATVDGAFFILASNGTAYYFSQSSHSNKSIEFTQKAMTKLKISCLMMLSTLLTLQKSMCLIVVADNGQSMAIWTREKVIYMDLDFSTYLSSFQLNSVIGERTRRVVLFHFQDKTLISGQVKLDKAQEHGSIDMTSFDKTDQFCLKHQCLACYKKGNRLLDLHNIENVTCLEPIQLENECLQLCLNESAEYAFALVKPRVLFMYRIHDRRQLAKLFVFDFVTCMIADKDFILLTMNDRRPLTLMIADPDDETVQSRIKELPSRNLSNDALSENQKLVKHMEECADVDSSSDDDSDDGNDDVKTESSPSNKQHGAMTAEQNPAPTTLYAFLKNSKGRFSQTKMMNGDEFRERISKLKSSETRTAEMALLLNDSTEEKENNCVDDDQDVTFVNNTEVTNEQQNMDQALDDIRQKTIEHDRQQLKGIQLANAGDGNLKVVNSYPVTSSTCNLI